MKLTKRNILTFLAHFLGGFLTSIFIFSPKIPLFLPIAIFILFVIYELDEDWHIKDKAYIDIRQFIYGLFVGGLIVMFI